jgi:4-hydroxysphinganine ceramide fatty acyl 2-hydroxylase
MCPMCLYVLKKNTCYIESIENKFKQISMKTTPQHYVSNSQESARMFRADWMEALSKVHFAVPLFIFIPVITICLWQSSGGFFHILTWFLGGLFFWTFTEYVLHRFLFHWIPPGKMGERLHFLWHGVHHDFPNDKMRLVLPPSVSIPLSFLFYVGFKTVMAGPSVFPFFSGFILGYLCYDMMHFAMHHLRWNHPIWLKIKNHHILHHYHEHDKGFGVSSPLWDYIFSTRFNKFKNKKQ